ncbi:MULTISPECIES: conjugative transfer system coupling protein TraD [Janthinobacterium]|uniref:conjugative transfer system coupling protein TraD n=1 Tax=Janthinobacterium TaxID=29580 RepID=UPI00087358EF|nr:MULTISPECIES: conjugative transfer system coupling protein TraD [Janthinobacterium]MCC7696791.1 conjugative transfer system coupling protein TraD [Janthinobacterium sp. EB271-G4-7A]MCC7712233.1 conjugative transfer system coupling protein TraD [Janthinobacterium lividum]OEZ54948.1 type IV secretion-system coupling protein DNA-binding domain protein [Janthinobacterium lividum]WQE27091.1 conjugative transfer system coupling protein TraD [Janthinobacterium lividum]SDG80910.1 conjugal transfer 
MARTYNDMFRPAYEATATLSWGASAVSMLVLQPPMWPLLAAGTLALSGLRAREAFQLYRFRASISALRVQKIPVLAAVEKSKRQWERGGFWLGSGFKWTQQHAEIARQIMFRSPGEIQGPPAWLPPFIREAVYPRDSVTLNDAMKENVVGVPWIHGINPEETELRLPFEGLSGHTLIVGTTRAGKTRLYEVLATQIIHKGDSLIVMDPKGDKDLKNRIEMECKRTGRKFLYFHPAHPSKSIRINPLANWNTVGEPATRIGQLISAEGTFAAFAWKTLFRIMRAQVANGSMPSIKSAKEFVQQGVEPLLESLIQKQLFNLEGTKWDANLHTFKIETPKGKMPTIKTDRLQCMVAKFEHSGLKDEAIESLIAMVNHSKEHYTKMIQVLEPILEMLGSDELGSMLSPDPLDLNDKRPIYDTTKIIEENAVLYVGLDSLSNKTIGSAIGSIMLADFASVAGSIYNFKNPKDIHLIIDEAAEVMNEQGIQLLNKGGGAGIKAYIATQTIADFDVVFGDSARTKQALGNLNNVICLRVKDPDMAEWIAKSFGTTAARAVTTSHSSGSGSSKSFTEFSGSTSRTMSEVEIPFVAPELLTRLPGLQYFAFLAGSTLYKGRLPLLY